MHKIIKKLLLRLIILVTVIFLLQLNGSAQEADVILDQPVTSDQVVGATHAITMLPGFSVTSGIIFTAKIVNPLNVTINGDSATLEAIALGGKEPYSYVWSTGETTPTINTDGKGTYSVNVIDIDQNDDLKSYQYNTTPPDKTNFNFIRKQSVLTSGVTSLSAVETLTEYDKNEAISYVDGLGRPIQDIIVKGSPSKHDIVQIYEYDENGKQIKQYLPYTTTSNDGAFRESPISELESFHFSQYLFPQYNNPYAETVFDNSPLNKVIEQGSPGSAWQIYTGRTIKNNYYLNTVGDAVKFWIINNAGDCVLNPDNGGEYPANSLYKFESIDEHGHSTFEYKDAKGKVIYQYTINSTVDDNGNPIEQLMQTYYVYDELDKLRCVIPPKAVSQIGSASTIDAIVQYELVYSYHYDNKGRLIEKRLPGIDPIKYIYDKRNRLVMSQDGNKAVDSQWSFVKYDILNRQIMSGIVDLPGENDITLQNYFNDETYNYHENTDLTATYGYTVTNSFPPSIKNLITEDDLQTVTYYDNYSFLDGFGYSFNLPAEFANVEYKNKPTGAVTGTFTRVLDNPDWLLTVNYYDEKGRLIQTINENHANGLDVITNEYDFTGKMAQTKREHNVNVLSPESIDLWEFYTYDHTRRLKKQYHQIGPDAIDRVLMAEYDYTELGQIWKKKLHSKDDGDNFLQEVDYSYNIRGWLTGINHSKNSVKADLFREDIWYAGAPIKGANLQYNGNIAMITWDSQFGYDYNRFGYIYKYDDVNRMNNANYYEDPSASSGNDYSINASYDNNGNISSATRNGESFTMIDDLTYNYLNNGNKLRAVGDAATDEYGRGDFSEASDGIINVEYTYDKNGNMLTDANKGLSFVYNSLNRISHVNKGGQRLSLRYDAYGNKLTTITDILPFYDVRYYVAGINYFHHKRFPVYPGDPGDESFDLEYIQTAEGRILRDGTGDYHYEYFLRDHLGNVRVSFADYDNNGIAEIVQKDSYYPFGLRMSGLSALYGTTNNNYLYNSKELYESLNLDWYDYGSRFYDPQLGRWHAFDPQAEKLYGFSPYSYGMNSPFMYIDPNGEFSIPWELGIGLVSGISQTFYNILHNDMSLGDAIKNSNWIFDASIPIDGIEYTNSNSGYYGLNEFDIADTEEDFYNVNRGNDRNDAFGFGVAYSYAFLTPIENIYTPYLGEFTDIYGKMVEVGRINDGEHLYSYRIEGYAVHPGVSFSAGVTFSHIKDRAITDFKIQMMEGKGYDLNIGYIASYTTSVAILKDYSMSPYRLDGINVGLGLPINMVDYITWTTINYIGRWDKPHPPRMNPIPYH